MSRLAGRAPAPVEVEVEVGGYPIRHLSTVVIVAAGGVSITTVPDQDGRCFDPVEGVAWLRQALDDLPDGGEDFLNLDVLGECRVRVDGVLVPDVVLVVAGCHDGLFTAMAVPAPDGWALDAGQVRQLVAELEARALDNPDGDEPPRPVLGEATW